LLFQNFSFGTASNDIVFCGFSKAIYRNSRIELWGGGYSAGFKEKPLNGG
jgi:hypothetical protein